MRVSIVRGGGLAGLVRTVSADSAALAEADAQALRARVDEAGLLQQAQGVTPASGAGLPDATTSAVVVEEGGRRHTIPVDEAALSPALRALVDLVESVPGREERVEPAGPPGP
jgi:hypothetical protein